MDSKSNKLEDEYILQDVTPVWLSDESITPNNLPRITQPSYGKYMIRADGKPDFKTQDLHPQVLERLLKKRREFLIPAPHTTDLVLKMGRTSTKPYNFHPNNRFRKKLFPRPYCCELDYLKYQRSKNVEIVEARYNNDNCKSAIGKITLEKNDCKFSPPFWWKGSVHITPEHATVDDENEESVPDDTSDVFGWKTIPDVTEGSTRTPCQRRRALHQVGLPFKHVACVFYYEHYPGPPPKMIREPLAL